MRIVEVVKGPNKGKFVLQECNAKGLWKTIKECNGPIGAEIEYRKAICPFKEDRLVNDRTFAVRFRRFLEGITVCDACSEEELDYLKIVADKLLTYQKETVVPNSEEERYLKNCKVL